jgi:SagB-type dehydrogenase family enzyme
MRGKDFDYLVIAAMLLSGLYVTLSGLIAGLFGFPQFFLHRYAGYTCAALVLLHLVLNWRRVTAYLRQRFRPVECRPPRSRRDDLAHEAERGGDEPSAQRFPARPRRSEALRRRQLIVGGLAAVGGFALGRLLPGRQGAGLPHEAADLGELYHQWSKPGGLQVVMALLNWGARPEQYKTYADAERVALPDPHGYQGLSLEGALEARRSVRGYAAEQLSLTALSRLLHAAQGITEQAARFRAAPSAGALYPIELYPVVHDVAGLESGIYHYAVRTHELELLEVGDFRVPVVQAGLGQGFLAQAGVCFVLSAIFQRTRWRYRERAYRYVLLEAGHVGQNLYLAATSMGLGACAVGAFLDNIFNDLLGLDGKEEAVLYVISVGTI